MSELKSCPFCEPEISDPELIDHRTDWFVRCNGCSVIVYGDTVNHLDHIEDEEEAQLAFDSVDWDALRQTAIDKWNTRKDKQPTIRDYIKANESGWKKCRRKMVNISSLYEFIGESE